MQLEQWQQQLCEKLQEPAHPNNQDPAINVYRNNCLQALLSTLKKTYPLCLTIVGEECFSAFARQYIDQHPLESLNLNQFGKHFPALIDQLIAQSASQQNHTLAGFDYLPELCQLEWNLQHAYYAADQTGAAELQSLAQLPESQQGSVQLVLADDVSLQHSSHPVGELWLSHQNKHPKQTLQSNKTDYYYIIYRDNHHGQVKEVSPQVYSLLTAIASGATLNQLTTTFGELTTLPELINQGWIVGCIHPLLET